MSNKMEYRLPPINSLSLNFPLLIPQSYHSGAQHVHGLSSPQMAAHGFLRGSFLHANHVLPQAPPLAGPPRASAYGAPSWLPLTVPATHISGQPARPSPAGFPVGLAEYTLSQPSAARGAECSPPQVAAVGVPPMHVGSNSLPLKSLAQGAAPFLQQPSPSSTRRSSSISPLVRSADSPQEGAESDAAPSICASADASGQSDQARELKRRKKRQCPECRLFFSNLATHKSTHLNPTARPHVCNVCSRGFARPNDLSRHYKCHWKETGADNGQFKCPFKNGPAPGQCSHTLGIFSRCDTYKNHLKAIHFDYPGGTRKNERATSPGCCGLCQKQFLSVDEWLVTHVDTQLCESMH
ncbi:hypothetical protein METBIDRAFT_10016 [Metschnikowia bicuspidata var. bicuspidata NRRL YB-4993]|uniref:C2H2-type domain-containing protein n=1 Tax=Metschnikowia bicuspidata var. bicuspidata NRRL YB-4993 TaxID=869754 RepID=A0A1A0HIX8_9ASCO|nr:hypothetical protein METBIDRAFT_10016 [Metschnikowia bicuspidata var. bicuspidata NRRL YB-4993]OBA23793.1 hypothetical protein METBIDRAFT_10016 [Metschnikowia bicuspidata var. bicuspidata NRRL YB-4993]